MAKGEPVNLGGSSHTSIPDAGCVATGMKVPSPSRSIITIHTTTLSSLSMPSKVPFRDGDVRYDVKVGETWVEAVRYRVAVSRSSMDENDADVIVVVRVVVVCAV